MAITDWSYGSRLTDEGNSARSVIGARRDMGAVP